MSLPAAPARARRILAVACGGLIGAGVLAGAAGAAPATLYAAPGATATSGCTQSAPCRLDAAVAAAAAGDTVIVEPGQYVLAATLTSDRAITLAGAPGQARPALVANAQLNGGAVVSFSGGGVISHLEIDSHVGRQAAVAVDGATAQDLVLQAKGAGASALLAFDAATGTTVRTVLALALSGAGPAVRLADGATAGLLTLDNVTAVIQGPTGTALSDEVIAGAATVRNSILSAPTADITARSGTQPVSIAFSDFALGISSGYTDAGGNVALAPIFSADGSYREDPSSPTIGAGSADGVQTGADLDGNAWSAGVGPDMGAYEYIPSAAPVSTGSPGSTGTVTTTGSTGPTGTRTGATGPAAGGAGLPAPSAPKPGVSVTLRPASGTVTVELPGGRGFVSLARAAELPVGAIINTTRGAVKLTSAVDHHGHTRTGTFSGGTFVIHQGKGAHPQTVLSMVGGSFAACTRAPASLSVDVRARAARPWPGHPRVVRQLWGHDRGGHFTTIGRSAAATVRGTVWLTQDRCDGTLIRVLRGHVSVYDRARHRRVLIGPGHAYLARA